MAMCFCRIVIGSEYKSVSTSKLRSSTAFFVVFYAEKKENKAILYESTENTSFLVFMH